MKALPDDFPLYGLLDPVAVKINVRKGPLSATTKDASSFQDACSWL